MSFLHELATAGNEKVEHSIVELARSLEAFSNVQLVVVSAVALVLFYMGGCSLLPLVPTAQQERRRAWILTLFSSIVMVPVGSYFAFRYTFFEFSESDHVIARAVSIFFLSYCFVDVVFAFVQYPNEVGVGYEHHAFYALLLMYLIYTDRAVLFGLGAVEEIPTLFLTFYEMVGDQRPRLTTGMAMFWFRVSYHLVITYSVSLSDSTDSQSSLGFNSMLFLISMLLLQHHLSWFRSWFKKRVGIIQQQRTAHGTQSAATDDSSPTVPMKPLVGELESHMYIVITMIAAQTAVHGYFAAKYLHYSIPTVNWGDCAWSSAQLVIELAMHVACFLLVTIRMVAIVRDVYMEHFIMHSISQDTIIYNISWEDPRVEREAIGITKDDVILTISSAGCNVLDYLIDGPKAIVACDFNRAQLAVLELKLTCIKLIPHEQFFALWAESNLELFKKIYQKTLRPALSATAREFWDRNGETLFGENFMFAGTSGLAAKMLHPFLKALDITSYMASRKLYVPASVVVAVFRKLLASQTLWAWMAPLGGVPQSQLDLIKRDPGVWATAIEEVVGRRMWLNDNYFYYAYIVGKWSKECCPRYMMHEHYAALRAHADRVTLHHGPIAEAAKLRNDITLASLLDSMDWMPHEMIAGQLAALVPQMQKTGKIFWRSFATQVHTPVLASLKPTLIPDDGRERVGWYLSQWVAPVPGKADSDYGQLLNESSASGVKPNSLFDDVRVMLAMGAHAARSEKDTKAFYKSQGPVYDGFREALLPDRDVLLKYCLPWPSKPSSWLSVGCGTARDIEYVLGHLKSCKTKLYLLDLSPALLEMATERIKKLGLESQTVLLEADICTAYGADGRVNPALADKLPPIGTFDMVTCSYCLTMIPNWSVALEAMIRVLRKGGTLALTDFTKRSDCPTHWTQRLNGWWFANDGVWFNEAHTETLNKHAQLTTTYFSEAESRVPYTPIHATHYLWCGVKK